MLSAHYRSPLNFSADLMEASKSGLERIVNAADHLKFLMKNAEAENMNRKSADYLYGQMHLWQILSARWRMTLIRQMQYATVFDLVKFTNSNTDADSSKEYLGKLFELLVKLTDVLGLIVDKEEEILAEG